ncbi:MAG: sigma factor-like helix-turn-helix DNA-binding protein [Candidatus Paceibacterota bacterium]|jgi:DNA-directed RNA polymerase delta subunit
MATTLGFKPKQSVKKLLLALPERSRDVITKRYGLGDNPDQMTLDAIGKTYGITRERVRQIENHAINAIRKSKNYSEEKNVFDELEKIIHSLGDIIVEQDLLDYVSKDSSVQSQLNFLLVVGHPFKKIKEDEDFKHRWFIDDSLADKIHSSLKKLYENLKDNDLISEQEMIKTFLDYIEDVSDQYRTEEIAKRWLSLSKKISKNPLGEWGKSESSNINTKGMRDYAYLVIRKHGSPIHFREVAKAITTVFNKKAHVATTHNELIKDPRFVLVGRGLYALSEWGYMSGVVKDVIKKIIDKNGPMTKQEIVEKVMKERYVKENTIIINLQNKKYFKKNKDGRYDIVK